MKEFHEGTGNKDFTPVRVIINVTSAIRESFSSRDLHACEDVGDGEKRNVKSNSKLRINIDINSASSNGRKRG